MRLTLGTITLELGWIPIVVFIGVTMLPETLLDTAMYGPSELRTGGGGDEEPIMLKLITLFAAGMSYLRYNRLSTWWRNFLLVLTGALFLMVLESFYKYGKPLQYPHVFSKLMILYTPICLYSFFRRAPRYLEGVIMAIIVTVFLFVLFVHYPHVLSLSSFVDTERGITSYSTHFILLPTLWFLGKYLEKRSVLMLVLFLMMAGFVVFLNHRSVWLAMGFALVVLLTLIFYKSDTKVPLPAFTPIIALPTLVVFLVGSFVLADNPEVAAKIVERIEDISKADEQGTGQWRLQQFESYLPFILDNPILGMRFEGYELPNQFIAHQTGKATFDDGTGHHFHSFYVDSLFYIGLVGLLILITPAVALVYSAVRSPLAISPSALVWISYVASGVLYGTSYTWRTYYVSLIGVAWAVFDDSRERSRARARLAAWQAEQAAYEAMLLPDSDEGGEDALNPAPPPDGPIIGPTDPTTDNPSSTDDPLAGEPAHAQRPGTLTPPGRSLGGRESGAGAPPRRQPRPAPVPVSDMPFPLSPGPKPRPI